MAYNDLDSAAQTRIEAAAFRRMLAHLDQRSDVQNIDLMNLAGFCRNCLSTWLGEAAQSEGVTLDKAAARAVVYGMPYEDWKAANQTAATAAQLAAHDHDHPS